MALSEQRGKFAICRQQSLLFAAGQKKIRRSVWIRGARQSKRIVVSPSLTPGRTKNRFVVARLLKPPNRECSARNVDGRTDSAHKSKKIGMPQSKLHCSKTTHRNAHNRTVRSPSCRRKLALHFLNEIFHYVVFV